METQKQCSNCIHFKADPEVFGECHLNPPGWSPDHSSAWPSVRAIDWCSKFKASPGRSPGRPELYTPEGLLEIVTPILTAGALHFKELHKKICAVTPMHGLTAKKRLVALLKDGRLVLTDDGYALPPTVRVVEDSE